MALLCVVVVVCRKLLNVMCTDAVRTAPRTLCTPVGAVWAACRAVTVTPGAACNLASQPRHRDRHRAHDVLLMTVLYVYVVIPTVAA